jgi:hypothetical protein
VQQRGRVFLVPSAGHVTNTGHVSNTGYVLNTGQVRRLQLQPQRPLPQTPVIRETIIYAKHANIRPASMPAAVSPPTTSGILGMRNDVQQGSFSNSNTVTGNYPASYTSTQAYLPTRQVVQPHTNTRTPTTTHAPSVPAPASFPPAHAPPVLPANSVLLSVSRGAKPVLIQTHGNIHITHVKAPNGTSSFIIDSAADINVLIKKAAQSAKLFNTTTPISHTGTTEEAPEVEEV